MTGKVGEKATQNTVIVKADDQAKEEKSHLPVRPIANDRQIGCQPVGTAYKQDCIDGNNDICSQG